MNLAIKLGILSAANLGFAFLLQWYIVIEFGPGVNTDALFAGATIPQFVLAIISGSLMHVLVPMFSGESEEQLRRDAWGFLILIGGLFGLITIILELTASWWVPLTVPGFDVAGQVLTIELARIQLIGLVFAAINGVQWATYHSRQQFLWAESTPIFGSAIALLLLVWALPRYGVIAAAWISVLRFAFQALLLAPGMGLPVSLNLKSHTLREGWKRVKPLLLGTAYYKTDPVVDRVLLSMAGSGSLTLYYVAQQIYGAVGQVANKAIAVPLVPELSRLYKAGDRRGFQKAYSTRLLMVGIVGFVAVLMLGLFGQGLLTFVVGHRNVSSGNVKDLWWIMMWLSGMFVGGVVGQVTSSSFYAMGDTSTPTRIGIYTYTLYVPAKLALFFYFGIVGLAVATSVFVVLNVILQTRILKTKHFDVSH